MKKLTRKEKKAEEARILAEMKAALEEAEREENAANEESDAPANVESASSSPAPQVPVYHCKRCRSEMNGGVCPVCGFTMYVPMDEKKANKIKLTLTAVGMVVFVALFIYLQIKKG